MTRPSFLGRLALAAALTAWGAAGGMVGGGGTAHAQQDASVGADLERLAHTLGAVHYLRVLCDPGGAQVWRDRMIELLSAGEIAHRRREALIGAFNAGYGAQQPVHRRCTPAAANLGNTLARQGAAEAYRLAARLGEPWPDD